jgi:hypothetical protein
MSSGWSNALTSSLKKPTFILVFLVLLAGAIGMNAVTSAMKLHFRKGALPLRSTEGLTALPTQIGSWVCVPEPQTVNADLIHELNTDKFVFRDYVDTSVMTGGSGTSAGVPVATKAEVLALEKLTPRDRAAKLIAMRNKNNNAVISVAVTYYTGKADTVPHVPERCYVADGFQPLYFDTKQWNLGEYTPGVPRNVDTRFIDFEDQTSRGAQNRCVSYFFHANGQYESDPNRVRVRLQDLSVKHAYFAKIEVMTLLPHRPGVTEKDPLKENDRVAAAGAMKRFLTAALPEVEKLLPDWQNLPQ